jgi:peptide/nickel transport system substrate-binding protein
MSSTASLPLTHQENTMKKKQILAITGLSMAALMALSACGGGNSGGKGTGGGSSSDPNARQNVTAKSEKGGTVYNLMNAPFSHLDPAQGFDGGVNNFYRLIYRQLTTVGGGGDKDPNKVTPDLATDTGTASDNNKTWKFTLKDDIFFQDGTPITSKDIKFGVERSLDPSIQIGSPYAKLTLDIPKGYKGYYESGPSTCPSRMPTSPPWWARPPSRRSPCRRPRRSRPPASTRCRWPPVPTRSRRTRSAPS